MQSYDSPSSRNTIRAAGGGRANDGLTSNAEIPGKVAEPTSKDWTPAEGHPSKPGSGVAGFDGGLIGGYVSGQTVGGTEENYGNPSLSKG